MGRAPEQRYPWKTSRLMSRHPQAPNQQFNGLLFSPVPPQQAKTNTRLWCCSGSPRRIPPKQKCTSHHIILTMFMGPTMFFVHQSSLFCSINQQITCSMCINIKHMRFSMIYIYSHPGTCIFIWLPYLLDIFNPHGASGEQGCRLMELNNASIMASSALDLRCLRAAGKTALLRIQTAPFRKDVGIDVWCV